MDRLTTPRQPLETDRYAQATDLLSRVRRFVAQDVLGGNAMLFMVIALAGVVVCTLFEMNSRGFPFWDFTFYQNQTFAVSEAFARSFGDGYRLVTGSLSDDYNLLLTVPLVPLIWLFGENRLVYIFSVFIVYFMPFVIIVSALARRIFPDAAREAGIIAALVAVATPFTWENVLQGYPDIGGATIICGMLLAYGISDRGQKWKPIIACGVLAGLAILFRRGFIYAAFAFYIGFAVDTILFHVRSGAPKNIVRSLGVLALSGVAMIAVVAIVAPGFAARIASPGYLHTFSPWEMSSESALRLMVDLIGFPALAVAVAGMFLPKRVTSEAASLTRTIGIATVAWVLTWLIVVRQGPTHYPHVLPFLMVIGLTGAFVFFRSLADARLRVAAVGALTALLVIGTFVAIPFTRPALALEHPYPAYSLPARMQPLVNPAYDEIMRLVIYLRQQTQPTDSIIVGASSMTFNNDLLREAEHTMFGAAGSKLQITYTSQVSTSESPAGALQHANVVVVAVPFQHHLRAEDQKVVQVLVDAFAQHWPVSRDFELLPDKFSLGSGTSVLVYKRKRESSLAVVAQTQQQIQDYLRSPSSAAPVVHDDAGSWVESTSPYPVQIVRNDNGTSSIRLASPARASSAAKTVIAFVDRNRDDVRISGDVAFYDPRCVGTQVVMGTQLRGPKFTVAGTFASSARPQHFDVSMRHVRGNPVFMELAPMPSAPERVEYCSIHIDNLAVQGTGTPVAAAVAASMHSDADPFVSASPPVAAAPAAGAAPAVAADWVIKTSPFPGDFNKTGPDAYRFSGHPTRKGQEPETVIETRPTGITSARVSGAVVFYSDECKGAQILAGTNYGSNDPEISAGVFTPHSNGAPFDVVVPNVAGKAIYLNLKSNPSTPDDITRCALHIDNLRVRAAG